MFIRFGDIVMKRTDRVCPHPHCTGIRAGKTDIRWGALKEMMENDRKCDTQSWPEKPLWGGRIEKVMLKVLISESKPIIYWTTEVLFISLSCKMPPQWVVPPPIPWAVGKLESNVFSLSGVTTLQWSLHFLTNLQVCIQTVYLFLLFCFWLLLA